MANCRCRRPHLAAGAAISTSNSDEPTWEPDPPVEVEVVEARAVVGVPNVVQPFAGDGQVDGFTCEEVTRALGVHVVSVVAFLTLIRHPWLQKT